MRAASVPAVPYGATAIRPDWTTLPAPVRAAVTERLAAPVVRSSTATAGFTSGFAAILTTATGERSFVKAAALDSQPHLVDWYGRELAITAVLPERVPAPRPRWATTVAGYFVVCFDAIDGRTPGLPWRPPELTAALDAWAVTAEALRDPPPELVALGLPRLADLARADLSCWTAVAAGREPMPSGVPLATDYLAELVALESALPTYAEVASLIHCDLRVDNLILDADGAAWICDWNWLCSGPPWFDTVGLLISAYAGGLDADSLLAAHPTAAGAPADGPDAALSALAGYLLTSSVAGPTDASPYVRPHQRWTGEHALSWLAERRRWS